MSFFAKSSPGCGLCAKGRNSLPSIQCLSFLGILALFFVMVPTTYASACTTACFCSKTTVTCESASRITAIPPDLPTTITELVIKDSKFSNPVIQQSNISYLVSVRKVYFTNCNLKKIEQGAFSNLRYLKHLDLSNNKLSMINPFTFRALNLNYLILQGNKGIRFARNAFFGLNVKTLVLGNSAIKTLDYKTFTPINRTLVNLYLDNNQISTLDPRFERLCSHLETFDISKNPLRCGCQVRWLVSYLKRRHEQKKNKVGFTLTAEDPPVCSTPRRLLNRKVRTLMPHEMVCTPPQMRTVEVSMEDVRRGRLACKVDGYPTPTITWSRVYPLQQVIQMFHPRETHYDADGRYTNRAEVTVVGSKTYEEYACIANNEGGSSNLTVKLRWMVMAQSGKTSSVDGTSSGVISGNGRTEIRNPVDKNTIDSNRPRESEQNRGTRRDNGSDRRTNINPQFMPDEVTEQNYFFRKQFTLLELIGAVVGTFTGTLALFVLIYRFISCTKKKEKKRTFSQYMYESAYSGSHEYDVPRIDHPGPPYGPPPKPPGADGMEFLDYKTHRKLYNHV